MFVACGLNYITAPLSLREKIALSHDVLDKLLIRLISLPSVQEVAVLSTCNRTEIYCEVTEPVDIIAWLAHEKQIDLNLLSPHMYMYEGSEGIRHLLRVAAGLDSMMLGEPQILGQMKQAYQQARKMGTIKQSLNSIFQYVFNASKRIRNLSDVGKNPVSIAYAAAQLISQYFTNVADLRVFLIGSGETASLVAKYLHQQGVKEFMVASRTTEHANHLAETFGGQSISIGEISLYLSTADVVISATACPLPFINQSLVQHALNERKQAPMFFLDLSVPRDIEENVGDLASVQLYNIDDLHRLIDKGMDERRIAASKAEQLIEVELDNYNRWHRTRMTKHLICDYRRQMQSLANLELERALQKLSAGQCKFNVLEELSERLVKKLTHNPTVGLRQAAWDDRGELLDLAHYLFNVSVDSLPNEEIT